MPWQRTSEGHLQFVASTSSNVNLDYLDGFFQRKVDAALDALCLTDSYNTVESGDFSFNLPKLDSDLNLYAGTGAAKPAGFHKGISDDEYRKLREYVQIETSKYGIPWRLIMALIEAESNFTNLTSKDPSQRGPISRHGLYWASIGYMQVQIATAWSDLGLPKTTAEQAEATLLEMQTNIYYGVKEVANKLKRYKGDLKLAIERYNGAGPAARAYVEKVYKLYNDPKREY